MKRDRTFADDAGRKGMLMVFAMLGGQGDLVTGYRSRMLNALYQRRITRILTDVKRLQIIDTFFEQLGLFLGPVFHRLKGRTVAQCFLRDVLIVDLERSV